VRLSDDHAFEQRTATVLAILDDLGPPRIDDSGKRSAVRWLESELDVPEAPIDAEVRFRYLEWWSRNGRAWLLDKYQYDCFDRRHGSRFAYHRHGLAGRADILHIHCEPARDRSRAPHYRSYEVDLLEAHEEFAELYLGGRSIDCAGLRPLRPDD